MFHIYSFGEQISTQGETHKMAILMVILTDQFNRCQNFAWFYIVSQFIQFHSKINRSIIQYFYPSNILLNIRMRKMKTPSKERMVHQYIILEEEVHTLIYLCQTLNILVPAAAAVRQSSPMWAHCLERILKHKQFSKVAFNSTKFIFLPNMFHTYNWTRNKFATWF